MKWAEHVARMGEDRKVYNVLVKSSKERDQSEDRYVDGIRMDLEETGWGRRVDSVGSGYGSAAGSCERGDEHSGSSATELFTQSVS
jgi:hypothetical protein